MISYQRQEKPTVVSAYDFIVVGAGSSGSVKPVPDIFHLLDTGTAGAAVPVINIKYSMIVWNCNKVNSYISVLKHLPRLPNRSKRP